MKITDPAMLNLPATITVSITQFDIDNGRIGDCARCPGALASIRAVKALDIDLDAETSEPVTFTGGHLYLDVPGGGVYGMQAMYSVPSEGGEWVAEFDGGIPVEPITFTVEFMSAV